MLSRQNRLALARSMQRGEKKTCLQTLCLLARLGCQGKAFGSPSPPPSAEEEEGAQSWDSQTLVWVTQSCHSCTSSKMCAHLQYDFFQDNCICKHFSLRLPRPPHFNRADQSDPRHIYSEGSPVVFSGANSQENAPYRSAAPAKLQSCARCTHK